MRNDLKFTADWFTKSQYEFVNYIQPIINKLETVTMLEIGSFEGLSSRWFIDNFLAAKDSKLYCVDTWHGSDEHKGGSYDLDNLYDRFMYNMSDHLESGKCITFRGESKTVLPSLIEDERLFDLIFIDGSHVSADVLIDGVLSYLLLKPGGMMVFDDYLWGLGDRPYKDIPYPSIEFIKNSFVSTGKMEIIQTGVMMTLRKII